ncbi:hypothetical protein V7S76_09990 [Aquirufa sp. ROCK2-A2]
MYKYISILFVSLFISCTSQNDENSIIQSKITSIYSNHSSIYERQLDTNLFSKKLINAISICRISTQQDINRIKNSNSPSDKPNQIEGEVLASLPDGFTKYDLKKIILKDNQAISIVEFRNEHTAPQVIWIDTIVFIKEHSWKMDNVIYDPKLNFNQDLQHLLKQFHP